MHMISVLLYMAFSTNYVLLVLRVECNNWWMYAAAVIHDT